MGKIDVNEIDVSFSEWNSMSYEQQNHIKSFNSGIRYANSTRKSEALEQGELVALDEEEIIGIGCKNIDELISTINCANDEDIKYAIMYKFISQFSENVCAKFGTRNPVDITELEITKDGDGWHKLDEYLLRYKGREIHLSQLKQ